MPKGDGVLFCGGGTGGHVMPGLAVAAQLRLRGERSLRWIGDPQRLEARLVPQAGIPLLPFGLGRPRPQSLRWLVAALAAAGRCLAELTLRPPRVVVALGGYAALLPGLLAPLLRRPLVVMEQNARPGRTNRLLARFARAVITQFPEASQALPPGRALLLGNPVRRIVPVARGQAPRLRILVVGGSLAARSLNDLFARAAPLLARRPQLQLVHIAGAEDQERIAGVYERFRIDAEVHGFVEDMPALLERVDLVVGRSGATTVAECCAAGLGALYIPLPWAAEDHQTANARAIERVGGALVMSQEQIDPDRLLAILDDLERDRPRVAALGIGAQRLARPDAAARVACLLTGLPRSRRARRRERARARWRAHVCQPTPMPSPPESV